MDGKQWKRGRKKKMTKFNFSKKQKLTSKSTPFSTTADATATATTQRSTERDKNALKLEIKELYNTPVWGGRRKPLSKVDKTGIGEA